MKRMSFMGLVVALIATIFGFAPANAATQVTSQSSASQADQTKDPRTINYTTRKGVEVNAVQTKAASATATTDGGTGGHIEVTSESYSNVHQQLVWSNVVDLLVNGAHQLAWWYPNHNITVTNKAIKKAPYVKVIYKPCAKQSASIAKQAHGASIVVAKVGSVICNTGKRGHIVGGFKWHVSKGPAVLKWNKSLKLYQHVFNLIKPSNVQSDDIVVGHITFHGVKYAVVKVCGNRMGGHVDVMYDNVVQVQYEQDIKEHGELAGETSAAANIGLSVVCDNGSRFDVTASASGFGSYSEEFDFSERIKLDVEGAHRVSFFDKSMLKMKANAKAGATASIKVDYFCSATPPQTNPPAASADFEVCTAPGGSTPDAATVFGKNNDDVTRTLVYTLVNSSTGAVIGTQERTVAPGQTVGVPFTGLAVGVGYTYSVTVKETGKSDSGSFTLQPCPPEQVAKPTLTPDTVNHTLVNQYRTVSTSGTVAQNHTASLRAWSVLGTISGTNPQPASGSFTGKLVGYTAPGEVPGSTAYTGPDGKDYTTPNGQDVIWWILTQDDGQVAYARVFVTIDPRPVTP